MVSTPTPILGFEEPASGDLSGAWAANANQVFTVIEQAISGEVSVSTTGGDTALTNINYATDQSRQQCIRIASGQTLSSNVRVFATRFPKSFLVTNESASGAFTVSFGYNAGNVVAIPRGCACHVKIRADNTVVFVSPPVSLTTSVVDPSALAPLYALFPVTPENTFFGVLSSSLSTPPVSPSNGDRYIVNGGSGAWTGHGNNIAIWNGSTWVFEAAAVAMMVWDIANHYMIGFDSILGWVVSNAQIYAPSGTVQTFYQAAAPSGWTRNNSINDVGMRVVASGTGSPGALGQSGQQAMSAFFINTTSGGHFLSVGEMPGHTHANTLNDPGHAHDVHYSTGSPYNVTASTTPVASITAGGGSVGAGAAVANTTGITINNVPVGGGSAHTHPVDLRLNYADLLLATKN